MSPLLLAWLVPGLGHLYQGRTGKGILYGVCILSLFIFGLYLGNWSIVYWRWQNPVANSETFCFPYLFQFWTGLTALPALIQATLIHYGREPNFLWGFMSVPDQIETNRLFQPLGKKGRDRGRFIRWSPACSTSWPCTTPTKVPPHPDEEPDRANPAVDQA